MNSMDHGLRTHWLTNIGLAGILLFGGTALVLNVIAWPQTIPGIAGWVAASLAVACFAIAFSMWEHIKLYARERRWGNLVGASILFAVALGADAYGTHRGAEIVTAEWRQSLQLESESERRQAQAELDRLRGALRDEIAQHQARIDAVPAADLSGGPQSDAQARAARADLVRFDESQRAAKQRRLDNMASVVEAKRRDAFLTPMLWAFSLLAEYLIAFGVSILGIEIPGTRNFGSTPKRKISQPSQASDNVVDFGTARDTREADNRDAEIVRRLKAEKRSYREIEDQTGISKSRAQRLFANAK